MGSDIPIEESQRGLSVEFCNVVSILFQAYDDSYVDQVPR